MSEAYYTWEGFPFDQRLSEGPRPTDSPPQRTEQHFILYHGSSEQGAQQIIATKLLLPDDLNLIGVTTTAAAAQSYAVMKRGPVLQLKIAVDELRRYCISHEIGGSGHDQFVVHGPFNSYWQLHIEQAQLIELTGNGCYRLLS